MYSAANLHSDDVIVDVITIRENQNFYLRTFVKSGSLQPPRPDVYGNLGSDCFDLETAQNLP
jgi:hypothetical protein